MNKIFLEHERGRLPLRRSPRIITGKMKFPDVLSLEYLPLEMTQKILSYLEIVDLENLARASKVHSKVVLEFLLSPEFTRLLIKERNSILKNERPLCKHDHLIEHAVVLGNLFRVSMVSFCVEEKMAILYHIMRKPNWALPIGSHWVDKESYLKFYGRFAERFIKYWNHGKIEKAHHLLENISGIETLVSKVLDSNSDDEKCDERSIRDYYRYIYFQYTHISQHGFLMALILWNYPVDKQAKLLYIIWGMVNEGGDIDWEIPLNPLSGYMDNNSANYPVTDLRNLGNIINLLHKGRFLQNKHIIELVRKIISIPRNWNSIQAAQLILSCGKEILGLFISELMLSMQRYKFGLFSLQCSLALLVNGSNLESFANILLELYEEEHMGDFKKFLGILPDYASHLGQEHPVMGPGADWEKVCTELCSELRISVVRKNQQYDSVCFCNER